MSADDARDRFGDALDGQLGEGEQRGFEAALAADAELREEYEAYRTIVRGLAGAAPRVVGGDALDGGASTPSASESAGAEAAPSLVLKVQARIRKRSKGRFFRDRFSEGEARGGMTALLLAATFLLLVAVWLLLQNVELVSP